MLIVICESLCDDPPPPSLSHKDTHKAPESKKRIRSSRIFSQPWCVPVALRLNFGMKNKKQRVTSRARSGNSFLRDPEQCVKVLHFSRCYTLTHTHTHSPVCVLDALHVGHVCSLKVRGSVTFHLLLSAQDLSVPLLSHV